MPPPHLSIPLPYPHQNMKFPLFLPLLSFLLLLPISHAQIPTPPRDSPKILADILPLSYNPPSDKTSSVSPRMSPNKTFSSLSPGLTFEPCSPTKPCAATRTCFPTSDTPGNVCVDENCICLPTIEFLVCDLDEDCPKGEACADVFLFPRNVCGSIRAVRGRPDLQLARSPSTDGLTMDICRTDYDCMGERICVLVEDDMPACRNRKGCFCLPPKETACFSSMECRMGEICSETTFSEPPICVSKKAEMRKLSLKRVVIQRPVKGFTLDVCRYSSECVGKRDCVSFRKKKLVKCDGLGSCACMKTPMKECRNTGECEMEEVCASTPFTNMPICVSIGARDRYEAVEQLIAPYTCPILIPEDPPRKVISRQLVLDSSTAGNGVYKSGALRLASARLQLPALERIDGGLFANDNLVRYMVAVRSPKGGTICSGTLISPKWFLTAAHCNVQPGHEVSLSSTQAFEDGIVRKVKRVFTHPKHKITPGDFYFDLSVVEIEGGSLPTSKFMKINSRDDLPRPLSPVRTVGFGFTIFGPFEPPETRFSLRQVDSYIIPQHTCASLFASLDTPFKVSRSLQFCGGSLRGSCTACPGDSGGPILQYQGGVPTILGVSSLGIGCGTPGFPSVFARVSVLLDWLKKTPAPFYTSRKVFNENISQCKRQDLVKVRKNIRFCRV